MKVKYLGPAGADHPVYQGGAVIGGKILKPKREPAVEEPAEPTLHQTQPPDEPTMDDNSE